MAKLAKMPEKVKTKWLEALRSGKYNQTTEVLQNDCGYCCLGVLCRVGEKEDADLEFDTEGALHGANLSSHQYDVYAWAGLDVHTENVLINLNDEEVKDFDEIADFIEEHL
jgi:hypothetical protein